MSRVGSVSPRTLRAALLLTLLVLILGGALLVVYLQDDLSAPPEVTEAPDRIVQNRRDGRSYQALYQIEAQAAREGWTPELRRAAGDVWYELGDRGAAVGHWAAAVSMGARDPLLLRELAAGYVSLQRWGNATDTLALLLGVDPEHEWGHYQLALIRAPFNPAEAEIHLRAVVSSAAYGETAGALLTVLRDYGADSLLSFHVGLIFVGRELWGHAELAFTYAALTNYPLPEAMAYVGLARGKQGKDGAAWADQAVALDPANPQVVYLYGLHLRTVGDFEGSLNAFLRAAIIDPQNPAIQAELGTAYRLLGDLGQAEFHYQQAVFLSGDAPQFQRLLAAFYAEEASSFGAVGMETLWTSFGQNSDDPDMIASYGLWLHSIGDTAGGLAELDRSLALAPDHPRALFYKARILLDSGDATAAVGLLERLVELGGAFSADAQLLLSSISAAN